MFTTLIVRPLFNVLVLIYALIPGHDFGLSLIIFTVLTRLIMWPLVKKQLHQAKAMRELAPEIKRIKQATKGNKQKESLMLMELYKEREISPFGSIGTLIIQLVVLIGLYSGLRRVVFTPKTLVTFSYPVLQHLSWLKQLGSNIHLFHSSLFGVVDLSRAALNTSGGIYWPAMIIVLGSSITQYYQAKQLMPTSDKSRTLRSILKEAGSGQQADQSEVNAAVGRSTRFFLPALVFIFIIKYPSAIGLYWLTSGVAAFIQQSIILREDTTELAAAGDKLTSKNVKAIPEAEVVKVDKAKKPNRKKTTSKRRKK